MTAPDPAPLPPSRPGPLPWLVGAVAFWQVLFIPLANLWEFVPRRPTPADDYPERSTTQLWGRFTSNDTVQGASETAGDVFGFWAEVTGQDQGWNMFTPDFPPHTVVPVAELRFADGTAARVESRFAPRDPDRPGPRWPLVHDREFNFQANITMIGWHATPEDVAARPGHWSGLPERVRENHELVIRWLRWKTNVYRKENPGSPVPAEVVLIFRYIPTRLPDDPTGAPRRPTFERPFARWLPGGPRAPGLLPLDGFDPTTGRFRDLPTVSPP